MKDLSGLFINSFNSILPVFLIFVTGFVFGKIFKKPAEMLGKLAFWLFGSVMVFTYINDNVPDIKTMGLYFVGVLMVTGSIMLIYFLIGKLLKKNLILWSYTNSFSNTGYIGYPVLEYSIGPHAIPNAVLMAITNMIFLPSIGLAMITDSNEKSIKNSICKILKMPWIYLVAIGWISGLLGFSWRRDLPDVIVTFMEMLKNSAITVILLVVGISLSKIKLGGKVSLSALPAAMLKLFLPPLLGLLIGKLLNMDEFSYKIFVMELAMPGAVNTVLIAEELGHDTEFASAVVVYSTFLFLFSFPVWYTLLV